MLKLILSFLLKLLDRIIYTFFGKEPRSKLPKVQSYELDVKEVKGETKPRVNLKSKDGLKKPLLMDYIQLMNFGIMQ
jgi:hypothetical protein